MVLITEAHTTDSVTDYPAAHKGQPQSLQVEIIQFANVWSRCFMKALTLYLQNIQSHCNLREMRRKKTNLLSLIFLDIITTLLMMLFFPSFLRLKVPLSLICGEIIRYLSIPLCARKLSRSAPTSWAGLGVCLFSQEPRVVLSDPVAAKDSTYFVCTACPFLHVLLLPSLQGSFNSSVWRQGLLKLDLL